MKYIGHGNPGPDEIKLPFLRDAFHVNPNVLEAGKKDN